MKNQKQLVQILVIMALMGFIACSLFMFYNAFHLLINKNLPDNYLKSLSSSLIYITSGLTGLVGGIVATGFGVKKPDDNGVDVTANKFRLQNLGSMVSATDDDGHKANYGFYYALSYIIIGVVSIVIWVVLGDNTIQPVTNMATTFFGMVIPIVATYFNSN